jgi:hypothetical protein
MPVTIFVADDKDLAGFFAMIKSSPSNLGNAVEDTGDYRLFVSDHFPPPCCRRAGLQYAFRHEESGSQHDYGCC